MKKSLLVFSAFILLTVLFTYPVIFNLSGSIYGPLRGTDVEGGLYGNWWAKIANSKHLNPDKAILVNYPFGNDYSKLPKSLWPILMQGLSCFTNDIAAQNIVNLLSFILTGIFGYYLVRHLTGSGLAGFFSGTIIAFCPYHINKIWEHPTLAHIQWVLLYIWMLLMLFEKRTFKYIILSALSLFLIVSFDFYSGYFISLTTIGVVAFVFFYGWQEKNKDKKLFYKDFNFLFLSVCSAVLALVMFSPFLIPILKGIFFSPKVGLNKDMYARPFSDLFFQSARPLSYLLPAVVNPVLSGITMIFKGTIFYGRGTIEHTLYLGWTPLALAWIAVKRIKKNYQLSAISYQLKNKVFYINLFFFIAIFAFVFSMPPYFNFGIFKLPMPSFFMYKILPMFRAYARFGAIVMLAVSVLAGFGLKFILDKQKSKARRYLIAGMFCALVLFEFNNMPPLRVTDVSKAPDVYKWLSKQPGDLVIAEYPMSSYLEHLDYGFNQRYHLKKMINGAIPGAPGWELKKKIAKISSSETAGILKFIGVKYVILHLNRYRSGEDKDAVDIIGEIPDLKNNPDFKLAIEFPDEQVFEVIAKPINIDLTIKE
jgi:hypothetical protein